MPQDKSTLFQFSVGDFVFLFDRLTIEDLSLFVGRTCLHEVAVEELFKSISRYANTGSGLLTKRNYRGWISTLPSSLEKDDYLMLENIFDAFDRNQTGVVDIVDLACGLSVLCRGSKSDKLAFAFDSMDDDGDGFLTKRGLWRYFRAFLGVLITLSGAFNGARNDTRIMTLDDVAVATAAEILENSTVSMNNSEVSGVTFEEIAEWYSLVGHSKATWLELLDLKKWMHAPATAGESKGNSDDGEMHDGEATSDDDDNDDDLGSLQFNIRLGEDVDEELLIYDSDASNVELLVYSCPLFHADAHTMVKRLQKYRMDGVRPGSKGIMTQKAFLDCFLMELKDSDADMKRHTMDLLLKVFLMFDPEGTGYVQFHELATGLTILGRGSKSYKLELGFKLWASADTGLIKATDLAGFLKSYLRVLVALSSTELSEPTIDYFCRRLAISICDQGTVAGNSEATFPDFSQWYNHGGHALAAWVELIDLTKWVEIGEGEAGGNVGEGNGDEAEAAVAGAVDTRINLRLRTELSTESGDDQISISKLTSAYVYRFARVLGLSEVQADDMYDIFTAESEDGLISKDGFDNGVRNLTTHTHQSLSSAEKDEYSSLLHSIFYGFDRTGNSELVDVGELCCGFSILCKGSKSEKLAFAFNLMDDDCDGYLTRRGLWRFFRAFLSSLLTLCGALGDHPANVANHILDASSRRTCQSIHNTQRDQTQVAFNDIADWYKISCDDFPWLELLDLQKWNQLSMS